MRCIGFGALVLAVAATAPRPAGAVASAELYRTQAYVYGRFESRIRYAAGDGVISSFFLWKEGSEAANAYWNELDFEKLGADCHMQTNAIYGNPESEHSQTNAMPGDICAGYHDYRFEWTPDYIAWSVDGKEIRRETGATATAFSQNASSGMTFHFNIWPGNANFGGNFSPGILPVHEFISWVQYSSYSNASFQVAWREEFDGGTVPSGWATGNWASPYSLSTHNTANVKFLNGIAVLSLTADNATGYNGVPPADGTSVGGVGGGGAGGASNGGAASGGVVNRGGSTSSGGAGGASNGGAASGGVVNRGGSTSSGEAGGASNGGTAAGGTVTRGGSTGSGGAMATGGASTDLGGRAAGTTSGSVAPNGGVPTSSSGVSSRGGATTGVGSSSSTVSASGGDTQSGIGGATSVGSGTAPRAGGASSSGNNSSSVGGAVQGTAASAPSKDDGGCGCRITKRSRYGFPTGVMCLFALALTRRRKRAH